MAQPSKKILLISKDLIIVRILSGTLFLDISSGEMLMLIFVLLMELTHISSLLNYGNFPHGLTGAILLTQQTIKHFVTWHMKYGGILILKNILILLQIPPLICLIGISLVPNVCP